jgi:hypothetical protein
LPGDCEDSEDELAELVHRNEDDENRLLESSSSETSSLLTRLGQDKCDDQGQDTEHDQGAILSAGQEDKPANVELTASKQYHTFESSSSSSELGHADQTHTQRQTLG